MKKFENSLKILFQEYESRVPKSTNRISQMTNKLNFVASNSDNYTSDVNKLINDHIKTNKPNDSEIEDIKKLSKEYLAKFSTSL